MKIDKLFATISLFDKEYSITKISTSYTSQASEYESILQILLICICYKESNFLIEDK